ncbi:MAG: C40 family peptidase [Thermonemataceae bacterium]
MLSIRKYTKDLLLFLGVSIWLWSCVSSKTTMFPERKKKDKTAVASSKGNKASGDVKTVINTARKYSGTPYKWGGNTKKGIDCSGLTCQAYQAVGITLPRIAGDQMRMGKAVNASKVQPGDLVFFKASKNSSNKITHVGIVTDVSDGQATFIHASTSKGVMESPLYSNYWKPLIVRAVRVL